MSIKRVNTLNPDSASIVNKEYIDISVSLSDISASGYSESVKTNYSATTVILTVPLEENLPNNMYYTPIYKEKIDYGTWLTRINKNFQELN